MVHHSQGNRAKYPPAISLLLGLYIVITLTYQLVGSVSLIVGYFDLRHQVEAPFELDYIQPLVTSVKDAAKQAGLRPGDIILSLNGERFWGRALWQRQRWFAHAGDIWHIGVRHTDGTQSAVTIPLEGSSKSATPNSSPTGRPLGEAMFVNFFTIVVPLLCLGLGYWVVLARPTDPNAWFILVILSYPEAFISVSTFN